MMGRMEVASWLPSVDDSNEKSLKKFFYKARIPHQNILNSEFLCFQPFWSIDKLTLILHNFCVRKTIQKILDNLFQTFSCLSTRLYDFSDLREENRCWRVIFYVYFHEFKFETSVEERKFPNISQRQTHDLWQNSECSFVSSAFLLMLLIYFCFLSSFRQTNFLVFPQSLLVCLCFFLSNVCWCFSEVSIELQTSSERLSLFMLFWKLKIQNSVLSCVVLGVARAHTAKQQRTQQNDFRGGKAMRMSKRCDEEVSSLKWYTTWIFQELNLRIFRSDDNRERIFVCEPSGKTDENVEYVCRSIKSLSREYNRPPLRFYHICT